MNFLTVNSLSHILKGAGYLSALSLVILLGGACQYAPELNQKLYCNGDTDTALWLSQNKEITVSADLLQDLTEKHGEAKTSQIVSDFKDGIRDALNHVAKFGKPDIFKTFYKIVIVNTSTLRAGGAYNGGSGIIKIPLDAQPALTYRLIHEIAHGIIFSLSQDVVDNFISIGWDLNTGRPKGYPEVYGMYYANDRKQINGEIPIAEHDLTNKITWFFYFGEAFRGRAFNKDGSGKDEILAAQYKFIKELFCTEMGNMDPSINLSHCKEFDDIYNDLSLQKPGEPAKTVDIFLTDAIKTSRGVSWIDAPLSERKKVARSALKCLDAIWKINDPKRMKEYFEVEELDPRWYNSFLETNNDQRFTIIVFADLFEDFKLEENNAHFQNYKKRSQQDPFYRLIHYYRYANFLISNSHFNQASEVSTEMEQFDLSSDKRTSEVRDALVFFLKMQLLDKMKKTDEARDLFNRTTEEIKKTVESLGSVFIIDNPNITEIFTKYQ